jgi:hypothetical protein
VADPLSAQRKPPEIGSLWRDREGNVWRLHRYNDGGCWGQLRGVTRFDGGPFENAHWHADWLLDLKPPKAVPVDG